MAGTSSDAPIVVLHVEDDEALRRSVAVLLRAAGCISKAVGSGEEALAWINQRNHDPDVLIVDFQLPGDLDGSDVAQEIFRVLGRPIPTIMLSGHLTEITPPWMPGAPLLCLWKPVHADILTKAVEVFGTFGRFVRRRSGRSGEQPAFTR
jgi:two-component system, chemotaxis family, CheB/CheR fusion protein